MATIFERDFELHHAVERHVSQCYEIMDPNGHRQWARPSPRVFILKELNAAECEGLACETSSYRSAPGSKGGESETELVVSSTTQGSAKNAMKIDIAIANWLTLTIKPVKLNFL